MKRYDEYGKDMVSFSSEDEISLNKLEYRKQIRISDQLSLLIVLTQDIGSFIMVDYQLYHKKKCISNLYHTRRKNDDENKKKEEFYSLIEFINNSIFIVIREYADALKNPRYLFFVDEEDRSEAMEKFKPLFDIKGLF